MRVERQHFRADQHSINPPMAFDATIIVYITRISDGSLLFAGSLEYRSRKRLFSEWGANDATHFRKELFAAQKMFAEMLHEQLFSATPPPKSPLP
jgi:hypothetical protein